MTAEPAVAVAGDEAVGGIAERAGKVAKPSQAVPWSGEGGGDAPHGFGFGMERLAVPKEEAVGLRAGVGLEKLTGPLGGESGEAELVVGVASE